MPPVHRWLLILFLLLAPIQFVWAAAAPYCGHEAGTQTNRHFGHHEHRHQADGNVASAHGGDADASAAFHADCEACHLGASAAVPMPAVRIGLLLPPPPAMAAMPRLDSHIPPEPERPDWTDSAAAARSGGGVVFGMHRS